MKNITRKIVYSIILLTGIWSCNQEDILSENAETHFFLKNEGTLMPVLVRGNTQSKVFTIVIHGGPGDESGISNYANTQIFDKVEKDFAMVYYDQRCSGTSQGNCNPKELSVSAYVDDLEKLVILLKHRYGQDISLFLMGHSWGGTLGLSYLIEGTNQHNIKGYIMSDGFHNLPLTLQESKDMLLHYGNQQIGLGNHVSDWQEILDTSQAADISKESGVQKINEMGYKTYQLLISVDSLQQPSVKLESLVQYLGGVIPTLTNERATNRAVDFFEDLIVFDISPRLSTITIPVGLYWGKYDFVVPPNVGRETYDLLGSMAKEFFLFDKSHHSPMFDQNEAYQDKVITFIQLNR